MAMTNDIAAHMRRLFGYRPAGSGSCRGNDHWRDWAAYDLWIFFLRVRTRLSTVSALPRSTQRLLRQRTARGAALPRCQLWRFAQGDDCWLCRYHRRHALEYRTVRLSRRCRVEILAGPERLLGTDQQLWLRRKFAEAASGHQDRTVRRGCLAFPRHLACRLRCSGIFVSCSRCRMGLEGIARATRASQLEYAGEADPHGSFGRRRRHRRVDAGPDAAPCRYFLPDL